MKNTPTKLRLVFIPFLLISICFMLGYTFLNWWLLISLKLFSVDEEVVDLWAPFVLAWVPILLWLRPRVKLLRLNRKKGDLVSFYLFIAWIAMVVPLLVAQEYIKTATGKLTRLENVTNIGKYDTRYYALSHYYIDKDDATVHTAFSVTGKYNEDFNMDVYVAFPIMVQAADTAGTQCAAWYGLSYHKRLNNHLSDDEKDTQYKEFLTDCEHKADSTNLDSFSYLERVGNSKAHTGYVAAVGRSTRFAQSQPVVLVPVHEPYENRNGDKPMWILLSFGIGACVWLLMVLIPRINEEALGERRSGVKKPSEMAEALEVIKPRKGYAITPILVVINLLIFVIMALSGMGFMSFAAPDLLRWGADYRPLVLGGEWWRLLTNMFLHGGLLHVLMNMYGLVFVGIFLEPVIGSGRYAVAYMVSGIIASLASIWWYPATVGVGASGAIFGLYGVFLALLLFKAFDDKFKKAFLLSTVIFVGYNLLMGLTGGIDNAAHIGGLVSGFVIGLLLVPSAKRKRMEAEAQEVEEE